MVEERGEQVVAGDRDGQPVQHRVGQPDRDARGGGQCQAQGEVGCDLPGSGRAGCLGAAHAVEILGAGDVLRGSRFPAGQRAHDAFLGAVLAGHHAVAGEVATADDAHALEELADVLEVVLALAADLGLDAGGLEKLRAAKAAERGSFSERIVWCGSLSS